MRLCRAPLSFPFRAFLIQYRCTSTKRLPNFSGKTTGDIADSPLFCNHQPRLFLVAQLTMLTFSNDPNKIQYWVLISLA